MIGISNQFQRISTTLLIGILSLTACGSGGNNNNTGSSNNVSAGPTATPAPPADAVTISMLYSSEKQAWVTDITNQFNTEQHKTADGKVIFVQTETAGS